MILATVTTCPQRWRDYQRLRRQFDALRLPFALRTFATDEWSHDPQINHNLNGRAALRYSARHLPEEESSWSLYLEDDVILNPILPDLLPVLVREGIRHRVDCWYLCNRKNPTRQQFQLDTLTVNELKAPLTGTQSLLLPQRHLKGILNVDWTSFADGAVFDFLHSINGRIWQIVCPVLVEHQGEYSTFDPCRRREIEVNYANPSNPNPSG